MVRARRALGVLAVVAAMIGGAAGPALAAPPGPAAPAAPAVVDPGCEQQGPDAEGYAPPSRCELLLVRAEGICLGAAPVLDYAVEPVGTAVDTVTLTWVNPAGDDLVQEGLPLSGRVYWPGTVVEAGVVVDWPGWTQQDDGTWTASDAYSYTRPQVSVELEVNPGVQAVVAYPPDGSACAGPGAAQVADVRTTSGVLAAPEAAPDAEAVSGAVRQAAPVAPAAPRSGVEAASGVLAVTGADSATLLAGAAGLLLLGAVLVGVASRRRHRDAG